MKNKILEVYRNKKLQNRFKYNLPQIIMKFDNFKKIWRKNKNENSLN